MTEVKAQRPSEAFSLLKASILVAIVSEIDGMTAMVSADFQNLINLISDALTPSERVVLRVVGKHSGPGEDVVFGDGKGLLVERVAKLPSERKRLWIDIVNIKGLDLGNLTTGSHLIALRSGDKYSIIPIV